MAEHLREQTIPEEMVAMADYYLRGVKRAEVTGTAAIPRQDMPMAVAQALSLDVTRTATHEEMVNLLQGRRADGAEIAGRQAYPGQPIGDTDRAGRAARDAEPAGIGRKPDRASDPTRLGARHVAADAWHFRVVIALDHDLVVATNHAEGGAHVADAGGIIAGHGRRGD